MEPDLLRPSIGAAPTRPLYSTTALFVPAFFGGPAAAAVVFGINAHRAGRLRRDAGWVLAGIGLVVLLPWLWLDLWQMPRGSLRYFLRGGGLAAAALYAWRHAPLRRAQELFGTHSPPGWGVGVVALGAALLVNVGAAWLLGKSIIPEQ
jgi:hypothetical protein